MKNIIKIAKVEKDGPCTTIVGLCASALGYSDIYSLSDEQKDNIKKAHLLLTFYNAMQPGVIGLGFSWSLSLKT